MEFFKRKPKKDLNITPQEMTESFLRGKNRGVRDPFVIDFLASIFAVARRKASLTVSELSKLSEISAEDLIDLESRQLNPAEAVNITEKLKNFLEVNEYEYKCATLDSTKKK